MQTTPRSKTLSTHLATQLMSRIRDHIYPPGSKLPTEAHIMASFGVSRTVVREALSHLQAHSLVDTRQGAGTFVRVPPDTTPFACEPEQIASLNETIALLELRIALETEAAVLAALRRTPENLRHLEQAHKQFARAIANDQDAVEADYAFHVGIAKATQNAHFSGFLVQLGERVIPRSRAVKKQPIDLPQKDYLQRVHAEHESLLHAIRDKNSEGARTAVRAHLSNSIDRLKMRRSAER